MTAEKQYGDSTPKIKQDNWVPLGKMAQKYLEKSVAAMNAGHFEVAEAYHSKAVDTEIYPNGGDV